MQQVQDQAARKADFLTPTSDLQKVTNSETREPELIIEAKGGEPTRHLKMNSVAFQQLAAHCDIEARTARRLQTHYPFEFDNLINAHFDQEPKRKMLRTFLDTDETNGTARALLSDRFKCFDNENMIETILPPLMENDAQLQVVNAKISDSKLYMRFKSLVHTGAGANVARYYGERSRVFQLRDGAGISHSVSTVLDTCVSKWHANREQNAKQPYHQRER